MFQEELIDINEIINLPKDLKNIIYKNNKIIESENIKTKKVEIKLIVQDKFTMDLVNQANSLNMKFLGKTKADYSLYRLECGHFKEIKRSNFKNNSFKCRQCIEERWVSEAKSSNLEYLLYIDENRSLYKFLKGDKCDKDHIQIIGRKEVAKNRFKCQTCYNERLRKIALEKEMEYIESVKEHYAIYKLNCGHYKLKHFKNLEREVSNGKKEVCDICKKNDLEDKSQSIGFKLLNIPKGKSKDITIMCETCKSIYIIKENQLDNYICSNCEEISYYNDIKKLGLKFIKRIDRYKKLYQIEECKHYQIIHNAQILRKRKELNINNSIKVDCKKCKNKQLNRKLNKEAKEAGVEFLCKIDKDYGFYKMDCGHKQVIGVSEVRKKTFKCKTCKSIYLIDGTTEVRSNYEKIFGNYLILKKYEFEYEKSISDESNHKCDFYIKSKNLYVEIAGFLKNEYDIGNADKMLTPEGKSFTTKQYYNNLQHKKNIYYKDKRLIILYKDDFLNDSWKNKIESV